MSAPLRKYLGGVGAVRPAHRIDEALLARYLADTIEDFEGAMTLRQFEGGQSNPTYLIETPARNYVLRRKPPGALLKSAHAVDREFRVMSALFRLGFPVPEPLVLCDDDSITGTMFFVMRHVEGRIFMDNSMPDLTPGERAAIYDSVNQTLADLHRVDLAAAGLSDFGRAGNFFSRQIGRWSQQYQASLTEDISAMDRLIEWLPGAVPSEDETALVHGDFSFHNVVIHPTEPKVAAVLDWELSTTGHPLGDLMYHAMEWYRPDGVDARGTLAGRDLGALGVPALEDYVARYCARAGREPIANLAFHQAYNLFRVAAIIQGIVGRARDGTANAPDAAEQARRVRPLAEAAWRFAQQAGA